MKYFLFIPIFIVTLISCQNQDNEGFEPEGFEEVEQLIKEYDYTLNDFNVLRDTVRTGDTFGAILNEQGVSNDKIFAVATKFKDSFDVRRMVVGKPYVLLNSKDSLNQTQVFVYEKSKTDYAVVDFRDTLNVYNDQREIST